MGVETMLVVSAVAGAGGKIYSGVQANKAAGKQADIYDEQARAEQEAGAFQEAETARDYDTLLGKQKLGFAASGRDLEGSPLLVLDQTLRDKETELNYIRKNTSRSVSQLRSAAKETKRAGRNAVTTGIIGAFGSVGQSYGSYKSAKNPNSKSILGVGGE